MLVNTGHGLWHSTQSQCLAGRAPTTTCLSCCRVPVCVRLVCAPTTTLILSHHCTATAGRSTALVCSLHSEHCSLYVEQCSHHGEQCCIIQEGRRTPPLQQHLHLALPNNCNSFLLSPNILMENPATFASTGWIKKYVPKGFFA